MKLLNMLIAAFDEIDGTAPEYKAAVYGNGRLGAINPYEQYRQRTQFKMPSFIQTAKKIIGLPFRRIQERLKQAPRGLYPALPPPTTRGLYPALPPPTTILRSRR